MDKNLEFRQIILATDGESNIGENPIDVAKEAYNKGITISTIGIIDKSNKEKPLAEIQKIAEVTKGISEITDIDNFSKTMEMVTQKSIYKTIEQAVSKELKAIIGQDLEEMHPESRKKIIDVIDKMDKEIDIRCCVVIDASASMSRKIDIAKKSIINLFRALKLRKGKTNISVISFPDGNNNYYKVLCPFTEDIIILEKAVQNIKVGGTTPTGIAIRKAIELLTNNIDEEILDIKDIDENDFKKNIV